MRYILGYDGAIPGYTRGTPEAWSSEDVVFLAHPDGDDEVARAEVMPPWIRRRRVRVGRARDGTPLSVFAELAVEVQLDLLEAAEEWTERPALLVDGEDKWRATLRAVAIVADRCPEVRQHHNRLVTLRGIPLARPELALLLSRATGDDAPAWLLTALVDGGAPLLGVPPWTASYR